MGTIFCSLLLVGLAGGMNLVWAGNSSPGRQSRLPNPLTLKEALSYADSPGPELELAMAGVASARADLLEAASNTGVRSYFYVTPQLVDPSTNFSGGFTDDSSVQLTVTKRLYDFGQTRAMTYSARAAVSAQQRLYLNARLRRRLEIINRFFDVLLADARYAFDSEETAYNYVSFDKARYRHGVGQISDVDLLAYEDRYRQALVRRTRSQAAQRLTRAQLAITLDHPGDLPENVVRPDLPQLGRPVPDYDNVLQQALKVDPVVLSLRDQLQAAREKLAASERQSRPFMEAELQAGAWSREFNGRNDARASLNLCIPIYQGGTVEASVARARAEILRAEAKLESARQALRVDYDLALTWARIDALTGKLIAAPSEEATR